MYQTDGSQQSSESRIAVGFFLLLLISKNYFQAVIMYVFTYIVVGNIQELLDEVFQHVLNRLSDFSCLLA